MDCPIKQAFQESVAKIDTGEPITDDDRLATQRYFDHIQGCDSCRTEDDELMEGQDDESMDAFITAALSLTEQNDFPDL